ncbi:hypothetical protein QYS48_10240 [Marivirga arenosa]|uniref:Uncharacterized protein n=1 Tax=Marivirga arenosa TaxID=3059076 RepID=A0AA49JDU6_9BACT|nr:hypothetical protein [Marivirga sp. ABR2-2]WKK87149.2 hypothetical protein QYS48_10240 [Marivirga sp. ABR2-2]
MREFQNTLLFLFFYLISILFFIMTRIGYVNDIEYDGLKVRIIHSVTGNINEKPLADLKNIYTEFVTAAGTLIVFHHQDDSKRSYGCIGCDLDEIAEMVEFINKKIHENDKQDE